LKSAPISLTASSDN